MQTYVHVQQKSNAHGVVRMTTMIHKQIIMDISPMFPTAEQCDYAKSLGELVYMYV